MADPVKGLAHRSMLLDTVLDLELSETGNKVVCKSTGHEMPLLLESVKQYIEGKKYLRESKFMDFELCNEYREFLQPHNKLKNAFYCTLTHLTVSKDKRALSNHVNGKRFKKLLEEHKKAIELAENKKVAQSGNKKSTENEEEASDVDRLSEQHSEANDIDAVIESIEAAPAAEAEENDFETAPPATPTPLQDSLPEKPEKATQKKRKGGSKKAQQSKRQKTK